MQNPLLFLYYEGKCPKDTIIVFHVCTNEVFGGELLHILCEGMGWIDYRSYSWYDAMLLIFSFYQKSGNWNAEASCQFFMKHLMGMNQCNGRDFQTLQIISMGWILWNIHGTWYNNSSDLILEPSDIRGLGLGVKPVTHSRLLCSL